MALLKVTDDLNVVKPDMKQCHLDVLNVNFPLVCRGAGNAAEVVSYFWRGYQQPSGIGLSDRTSVALDPPLAHFRQEFLSVSRHRPPSHHISPPCSPLATMVGPRWVWVGAQKCVCPCVCVQV